MIKSALKNNINQNVIAKSLNLRIINSIFKTISWMLCYKVMVPRSVIFFMVRRHFRQRVFAKPGCWNLSNCFRFEVLVGIRNKTFATGAQQEQG